MTSFVQDGVLSRLSVCYSRDTPNTQDGGDDVINSQPKYVQDLMSAQGADLITWLLDDSAHVYVCGDAKNMAKDVFEKFIAILMKERSMTEKEARALMMTKRLKRTYHEDIWT